MKFSRKLALLFIGLSLLSVGSVATLAFENARHSLEAKTRNHLTAITLLKEVQFNNWIEGNEISLQNIAKRPLVNELMAALLIADPNSSEYDAIYDDIYTNHLTQLTDGTLGFTELFILHPNSGQILVSSNESHVGVYRENQPYFQNGKTAVFVQNPYYLLSEQRQLITLATPLTGTNDRLVGVLAGHLNFDTVSDMMLGGHHDDHTEDTFIINKFNFLLTHSRFNNLADENAVHTAGVDDCVAHNSDTRAYTNHHDLPVIGAYHWMPERELCIVTEILQEEAFAPIAQLNRAIAIASAFVLLLSGIAGLWVARSVTRPLKNLARSAEVIGQGKLEYSIATHSRDEIGELSRAFDSMVRNLKTVTASRDELDDEIERRQQVEQELRNRENTLAISLQAAGAGVWSWNIETGVMAWDATLERIHGLEGGTFGGAYDDWRGFVHRDDIVFAEQAMQAALDGLRLFDIEYRIVRTDHRIRYILAQAIVVRDEAGEPTQMIGINIDVTKRKEAEQALERTSHALLGRVKELRGLQDIGSYEFDAMTLDGYLRKVVERIPSSMQYPGVCIAAVEFGNQVYGTSAAVDLARKLDEPIIVDGKPSGHLYVGYSVPREFLKEESPHIHAIAERIGQYIGRRRLDEQLKETLARLEQSNTELQQFAYVASHDLQEPLRMVTNYLQLFEKRYKGKIDERADQFIYFAVDGATRMRTLINDLLTFSRVTSQGREFEATDLNTVITNTLKDLEILTAETNTTINVASLPTVQADASQMHQLFLNLISNAIKFRSDEPPVIDITTTQDANSWTVCVADNGIGIDPAYFGKIFVIFQRLHTREQYSGTGIGLAVCKRIVERHNGQIQVESTPGEGTRFIITIPLNTASKG